MAFKPRRACVFCGSQGPLSEKGLVLSERRDNAGEAPREVEITIHRKGEDPTWFMGFFEEPIGHQLEEVFGTAASIVRSAQSITAVKGTFKDPESLDFLRNTIGVVTAVAEHNAIAILDLQQFTWFTPARWQERFVAQREFEIKSQVALVVTDDERYRPGLWMHTRGMIKFGRPELQIRHIRGDQGETSHTLQAAAAVLNAVAEYLALGAVVGDQETMAFPGHQSTVAFKAYADDSGPSGHFQNSSLQIVDFDRETGRLLESLDRHLAEGASMYDGAARDQ